LDDLFVKICSVSAIFQAIKYYFFLRNCFFYQLWQRCVDYSHGIQLLISRGIHMGSSNLESDCFYSKKEGKIEKERITFRNSESASKENR